MSTTIQTLGSGGRSYGEWLKRQSNAKLARVLYENHGVLNVNGTIVAIVQTQIDLGYILRDDLGEVRVGYCEGYVRDNFQIERRQCWKLISVGRCRIKEVIYLN